MLRKLSFTLGILGLLVASTTWLGAAPDHPPLRGLTPTPPARPVYHSLHVAVPHQAALAAARAPEAEMAALVDRVDGARWHADVVTLAQFGAADGETWGTRHTFTSGNLEARDWLAGELENLGWDTYLDDFFITGGPIISTS